MQFLDAPSKRCRAMAGVAVFGIPNAGVDKMLALGDRSDEVIAEDRNVPDRWSSSVDHRSNALTHYMGHYHEERNHQGL